MIGTKIGDDYIRYTECVKKFKNDPFLKDIFKYKKNPVMTNNWVLKNKKCSVKNVEELKQAWCFQQPQCTWEGNSCQQLPDQKIATVLREKYISEFEKLEDTNQKPMFIYWDNGIPIFNPYKLLHLHDFLNGNDTLKSFTEVTLKKYTSFALLFVIYINCKLSNSIQKMVYKVQNFNIHMSFNENYSAFMVDLRNGSNSISSSSSSVGSSSSSSSVGSSSSSSSISSINIRNNSTSRWSSLVKCSLYVSLLGVVTGELNALPLNSIVSNRISTVTGYKIPTNREDLYKAPKQPHIIKYMENLEKIDALHKGAVEFTKSKHKRQRDVGRVIIRQLQIIESISRAEAQYGWDLVHNRRDKKTCIKYIMENNYINTVALTTELTDALRELQAPTKELQTNLQKIVIYTTIYNYYTGRLKSIHSQTARNIHTNEKITLHNRGIDISTIYQSEINASFISLTLTEDEINRLFPSTDGTVNELSKLIPYYDVFEELQRESIRLSLSDILQSLQLNHITYDTTLIIDQVVTSLEIVKKEKVRLTTKYTGGINFDKHGSIQEKIIIFYEKFSGLLEYLPASIQNDMLYQSAFVYTVTENDKTSGLQEYFHRKMIHTEPVLDNFMKDGQEIIKSTKLFKKLSAGMVTFVKKYKCKNGHVMCDKRIQDDNKITQMVSKYIDEGSWLYSTSLLYIMAIIFIFAQTNKVLFRVFEQMFKIFGILKINSNNSNDTRKQR